MNSLEVKVAMSLVTGAVDSWIYSHLVYKRKMVTSTYQELGML